MHLFVLIIFLPSILSEQITVCKTIDSNKVDEEISSHQCAGQTVFYEEQELKGDNGSRGEKGSKGDPGIKNITDVLEKLQNHVDVTNQTFDEIRSENNETFKKLQQEYKTALEEIETKLNKTIEELNDQYNKTYAEFRQNYRRKNSCPGVTFHLPRDKQTTDYVRYRNYVPRMNKATVCAWIGTDGTYRTFETFFSYAVGSEDNELFISFLKGGSVKLITGSKQTIQPIQIQPGLQTFHFCTWLTPTHAAFYINGQQRVNVTKSFNEVSRGGTLILGQDQDNGGFQSTQSFSGNITNLMIWSRVLSDQEINNIATKCDCPQDYSVAMTMDRSELYGEAYSSVPEKCPTL